MEVEAIASTHIPHDGLDERGQARPAGRKETAAGCRAALDLSIIDRLILRSEAI